MTIDHNGIHFTLRVCMKLTLIYLTGVAIEVWRHVNAHITKDDGTHDSMGWCLKECCLYLIDHRTILIQLFDIYSILVYWTIYRWRGARNQANASAIRHACWLIDAGTVLMTSKLIFFVVLNMKEFNNGHNQEMAVNSILVTLKLTSTTCWPCLENDNH